MRNIAIVLLTALVTAGVCYWLFSPGGKPYGSGASDTVVTYQDVVAAQKLLALHFEDWEIDTMLEDLNQNRERYALLHRFSLNNNVPPALVFNPLPEGFVADTVFEETRWNVPEGVMMPKDTQDLAFYSIMELASLLKNRQITSVALTQLYLDRIAQYDDTLEAVITVLKDSALKQAQRADQEIARGQYRGPLHGIPYGVKDLVAVAGYKTTWGSNTHKDQQIDHTATVVRKLEDAGAVLLAKLTSGALARGDVWFGGQTKNPWDLTQGASGSSAGSAAATVAGLVGFSLGTETMGSIVSPSTRCGATGLRPTYGRVSRDGVMTLSWSLDKVGPICRTAQDCAIVFDIIEGADTHDKTTVNMPFRYDGEIDLSQLRVGYLPQHFDEDTAHQASNEKALAVFRSLGAELVPVALPDSTALPITALNTMMYAEAGAVFDELTRTNLDDSMVQQDEGARPNALRQAHFIPAVEYIQASRYRYQLIQQMHEVMQDVDLILSPTHGFRQMLITNMTGHPVMALPIGLDDEGHPVSLTLIGQLYGEATLLEAAEAYQRETPFEEAAPTYFVEAQ